MNRSLPRACGADHLDALTNLQIQPGLSHASTVHCASGTPNPVHSVTPSGADRENHAQIPPVIRRVRVHLPERRDIEPEAPKAQGVDLHIAPAPFVRGLHATSIWRVLGGSCKTIRRGTPIDWPRQLPEDEVQDLGERHGLRSKRVVPRTAGMKLARKIPGADHGHVDEQHKHVLFRLRTV